MGVMTGIALGTLIAGTVVKARAAKKQGTEAQRAAEWNAQQAEAQATDATRRGVEDVNAFRRDVRGKLGTQRAGYAGQGVEVSSGTPAAMTASGEALLQSDLARLKINAEREAFGFKAEAAEQLRQGAYAKGAARSQMWGTILGGGAEASLLASRMNWGTKKVPTTDARYRGPS